MCREKRERNFQLPTNLFWRDCYDVKYDVMFSFCRSVRITTRYYADVRQRTKAINRETENLKSLSEIRIRIAKSSRDHGGRCREGEEEAVPLPKFRRGGSAPKISIQRNRQFSHLQVYPFSFSRFLR